MRILTAAIACGVSAILTCAASALGQVVTLEFSPATLPNGSRIERDWIEAGIHVHRDDGTASHSSTYSDRRDPRSRPYNGTDYWSVLRDLDGSTISIKRVDGGLLLPMSVDLAEYSHVFLHPKTIAFKGTLPNGEAIEVSFTIDGLMDGVGGAEDFESFAFPSTFGPFRELQIPSEGFALDNLSVKLVDDSPADCPIRCNCSRPRVATSCKPGHQMRFGWRLKRGPRCGM